MIKILKLLFFVSVLFTGSLFAQNRELVRENSSEEQRVALVIGNSAYETSPLKNPVNDARAIAQTLQALGFQVILKENINQVEMKRAVREFGEKIKNGGIGLFYFAGHGVQVKGQNYLVPIGAQITKEEEVEYEGLDVGFVMAQMESAKNRMNIVILDACRNNPFARSYRSESNGLASISAPSGTLIAYATAPGSVASDGTGDNGLYTRELLFNMRTIGLNIEEVFKRVRIAVREKTGEKQTPWESSSLTGDFYFVKSGNVKPNTANQQIQIPLVDSTAIELAYWNSIKDSKNTEDFKAYLVKYPNGQFSDIAKRRLENFDSQSSINNNQKNVDRILNSLISPGLFKFSYGQTGLVENTIKLSGNCQIKVFEKKHRNEVKLANKGKKLMVASILEKTFNLAEINGNTINVTKSDYLETPMWVVSFGLKEGFFVQQTTTLFKDSKFLDRDDNFTRKIQEMLKNHKGSAVQFFSDYETALEFSKKLTDAVIICSAKE
jgi:hypothetical protein